MIIPASVAACVKTWPLAEPFANARGVQSEQAVLHICLTDGEGRIGHGEAAPAGYNGETLEAMLDEVAAIVSEIGTGISREMLLGFLPAGGARCALDAALWDLEAKRRGVSAFAMAGATPDPVISAYTIGIRDTSAYRTAARERAKHPLLKVKVDGDDPLVAVGAVHAVAPDAALIVDPNQSWSPAKLVSLAPQLRSQGVVLIEQPIPVGSESELDAYVPPVPLCADELVSTEADLSQAIGCFEVVNIKLEKAGGLTAALRLADAAEARGFALMVGCMGGSSLSVAPAMILAQRCAFVDLDAPMFLASDCAQGFDFSHGVVRNPYHPELWG